jgi:hypothetical protein
MVFPYAHFYFFQNKGSRLIIMVTGMMVQQYTDPARLICRVTTKEIDTLNVLETQKYY